MGLLYTAFRLCSGKEWHAFIKEILESETQRLYLYEMVIRANGGKPPTRLICCEHKQQEGEESNHASNNQSK
jgi:hypothetical protein